MSVTQSVGIPVINLADYRGADAMARERFVRTLGDGLKEFGFITVDQHGIDLDLIKRAFKLYQEFFALPLETKRQYGNIKGGQRGYTEFGVEHAKDHPVADLKEFWHTGPELPAGHPYRARYPDNVWPAELPELKPTMLALYDQLGTCVDTLLTALADYFELPKDTFTQMVQDGNSIIRSIHYPPLPEGADPQAVRAAAHEDINLITVLCEATSSGLELLRRDGTWMAIDALEGQIVVDAGDMLQRITNHVIPATTHRVVNPPGDANVPRYSMPFFVHPYATCALKVLDCCVTPKNPAKYPPTTAEAFLHERLREIGLLK